MTNILEGKKKKTFSLAKYGGRSDEKMSTAKRFDNSVAHVSFRCKKFVFNSVMFTVRFEKLFFQIQMRQRNYRFLIAQVQGGYKSL